MSAGAAPVGLSELGRRIERLLYFGSLLLVVCFFELYFVSATVVDRVETPEAIALVISKFEANKGRLQALYDASKVLVTAAKIDRSASFAETRRLLGLPEPPAKIENSDVVETYAEAIAELLSSSRRPGANDDGIKRLIDVKVAPDEIQRRLVQRYQELQKMPVSIWGIETPLVVPVQYGAAQYQIPTSFIAKALLVALAPVLIGWFGSLYVTRQRELLFLRDLRDFKHAFPHVLNILPIVSTRLLPTSFRRKEVKTQQFNQSVNRIMSGAVRCFVLMLFVGPMFTIFCYSAGQLLMLRSEMSWFELTFAVIVAFCLGLQIIVLFAQEWIILWRRDYYV